MQKPLSSSMRKHAFLYNNFNQPLGLMKKMSGEELLNRKEMFGTWNQAQEIKFVKLIV